VLGSLASLNCQLVYKKRPTQSGVFFDSFLSQYNNHLNPSIR
jgi:hypothetical protein